MDDVFTLCDDIGPEKVLHIATPGAGLRAILVIDNVAAGPAIGGTRMAMDATLDECARLARAMTLKNISAGLPHGGAKSVIVADPHMPELGKERLIRAFARAIAHETDYIPGPDMGLDERCMGWVRDEIGRAVGLPREIGGVPIDEIGVTGFGLAIAAEAAAEAGGPKLDGARVVVQGFGAVGAHAARHLAERGAVLVGASDSRGAIVNPEGLDIDALICRKAGGEGLAGAAGAQVIDPEALVGVACEIWIPAARPDVLTEANAGRLRTRMVLQGANIPATAGAEAAMAAAGILCIPDFIANAGGVIAASVEYHRGNADQALATVEEKVRDNTSDVLARAAAEDVAPRSAATQIAMERLRRAMSLRRFAAEGG